VKARDLVETMLAGEPNVATIEAGSTSYRWLLAHVVERAAGQPATLRGLSIQERAELPAGLVVLAAGDGSPLTSIEVSNLESSQFVLVTFSCGHGARLPLDQANPSDHRRTNELCPACIAREFSTSS
jgi:hypothetical protein